MDPNPFANYKANAGSFLVGAVAGLKTAGNKIGYIGGADVPLLQAFEAGYVAGVQKVNPEAAVIVEYIALDASVFGVFRGVRPFEKPLEGESQTEQVYSCVRR